jgi:hypothetical protein
MGLLYRPIHLLVGDLPWSECVSPYTRDLTITLDQFALRQTELGIPLSPQAPNTAAQEDWYYEIAEHFLKEDPNRLEEKRQIEAGLGFMRLYQAHPNSLWIDSRRLDWSAADSRMQSLGQTLSKPYPVWMILNPNDFEEFTPVLQELARKLNRQLSSCTLALDLESEEIHNIQSASSTTRFYTAPSSQVTRSVYEQAAQTWIQSLGQTVVISQESSQPEAPKPKTGPMHRIKA